MNPSIPADDPTGNLIGSFVIVGEKLDSFEERLQTAADRVEVHEDAPEFDVRIGIERATSRSAIASAVHRALELKNV
ncbi:hypothetical protein, partial [Aeromonas veronii]|uniref:hypothetical protein n=1 Tax=Aeromonas veronii TaxID=654 RepID=UPI0038B4C381